MTRENADIRPNVCIADSSFKMDTPSSTEEYARHNNLNTAPETASPHPEHVPVANNAIGTKGQRRRASGVPGSRGVANLSAEQLAKKVLQSPVFLRHYQSAAIIPRLTSDIAACE